MIHIFSFFLSKEYFIAFRDFFFEEGKLISKIL